MAHDLDGRRVLYFDDGPGRGADKLVTAHGGVPVGVPDTAEAAAPAVDRILAGAIDFVLFHTAAQVERLLAAGAAREAADAFRDRFRFIAIATWDPEVSGAVDAAGLRADFEADPSRMSSLVRELARRGSDLLGKKRRSSKLGIDTNRWRRFDARWSDESGRRRVADAGESVFLQACRRQKTPYTPIWIMRQAGRYQREYRQLRSRLSFLELCRDPELAAEVTLMAADRLGVDAAILFSDILMVLEPMGIGLRFEKGDGPVIDNPVRRAADLDRLPEPDAGELEFVYQAVRLVRRALRPDLALIGFAGAPFTVASYIVEGGKSRHFEHTKGMMYGQSEVWNRLIERLTGVLIDYLNRQIDAGADAVQVFDSWVGCLSPDDYRQFVFPHMKRLFGSLRKTVPAIHFSTGNPTLLELQKEAGGDVIGVDWRIDLADARARLGDDVAVMGNLDPVALLSPPPEIRRRAGAILKKAGRKPGHIFNLGHGVLPHTPPDHVSALIDAVHELSAG